MKNNELVNQQPKIKSFSALPLERLSLLHRDIKTYHEKWEQDKVIQIADLATIENTYTALLHNLSKITSATGAGIYLYGEINSETSYKGIGGSITVTSLSIDFLVSSYKERRYRPEERKKDRDEFISETENLYNSYQELTTLLEHLHSSDASPELNKLVNSLKTQLTKIIQKEEIKESHNPTEYYLSYIFWSLAKDNSSDIKELFRLNNGIKALDHWNNLSLLDKVRLWPSSLLISWRTNEYWTEWKQAWETRRSEHENIKLLTEILQRAVSEYKQGIESDEIEKSLKDRMLGLDTKETEKDEELINPSNNSLAQLLEAKNITGSTSQSPSEFRRRTISNSKENKLANREVYELVELQSREELQTQIEQSPK